MAEITAVTIHLEVKENHYDLKIPRMVTIEALKEILRDALSAIQASLPTQFDFEVVNKPIKLEDAFLLCDYPISDGDSLRVIEMEAIHA